MRLAQPLIRLPIRFCAETLAAEAGALPKSAWVPHPSGFEGNDAALLVAPGGRDDDQGFSPPLAPTAHLSASPYIRQVMGAIGSTWGRSRLMRLAPGAKVKQHIDINYYWRTHWRLHIPVITTPQVLFTCAGETVHMAPGECWIFDSFRMHEVRNGGSEERIHLVLDTVGGGILWDLLAKAEGRGGEELPEFVAPGGDSRPTLQFEHVNAPTVMTPWEVRCHIGDLIAGCTPSPALGPVGERLDRFVDSWFATWAAYGDGEAGFDVFNALVVQCADDVQRLGADTIRLTNGVSLSPCLREHVFRMAVKAREPRLRAQPARRAIGKRYPALGKPVFVMSSPRSGSTLLFQTLIQSPDTCSIGSESHGVFEGIRALHPGARGWSSNRLEAADATPETIEELSARFAAKLRDRDGGPPAPHQRLVEKTPKNALRVPFLAAAYPRARFVFLRREARPTLASMIEAWQTRPFRTYPRLPGWTGPPWSLLLVPGWRELDGLPLAEIVARQWAPTIGTLLDDLEQLPPERVVALSYEGLVAAPQATISGLCAALGLAWDRTLGERLPASPTTVSAPDPDKWRRHEAEIEAVWPLVEAADARARAFAEARGLG